MNTEPQPGPKPDGARIADPLQNFVFNTKVPTNYEKKSNDSVDTPLNDKMAIRLAPTMWYALFLFTKIDYY